MFYFILLFFPFVLAFPETGHHDFLLKAVDKNPDFLYKTAYKNTFFQIKINCPVTETIILRTEIIVLNCIQEKNTKKQMRTAQTATATVKCSKNHILPASEIEEIIGNSSVGRNVRIVDNRMYTTAAAIYGIRLTSNHSVNVILDIKSSYGFLSAAEFPLLIFYSVMSGLYSILALIWLIISCRNWRDLLRIQFWIGAVIVLGMMEKAFFVSEYQKINSTGTPLRFAVLIAEIVSCTKRSLARILIMVVCIGYGIVKPRLGPAMRKIVLVGVAYFLAALTEGAIRVLYPELAHSKYVFIADLALVVIDSVILWWSFSYLIQTIKQMRQRRNVVKFDLYRHFSNILIILVVASVIFMIWALYTFQASDCNKNWQLVWMNEAVWHILFSLVLMTIMVLWRPSKNNQRYAYSPLLDPEDAQDESDDEEESNGGCVMNNLTSGELRKPAKNAASGSASGVTGDGGHHKKKNADKSAEDDLKWIEENIPTSAAEKIYPIMDSDEELTTNKLANNKMD